MISKIERVIQIIERLVVTYSLMIILISTVLQVAVRFFKLPIIGTDEISLLHMFFLTFIGAGLAVYTKDHIAIEVIEYVPSQKIRYIIRILSSVFMLVFGVMLLYVVFPFFIYTIKSGEKTLELNIPLAIPIGSLIIGMGLIILHSLGNIIRLYYQYQSQVRISEGEERDHSYC